MKRRIWFGFSLVTMLALFFALQHIVSWRAQSVLDYRRPPVTYGTQNGLRQIGLGYFSSTRLQIAPDESHLAVIRDDKLQIWRLHPPRLVRAFASNLVTNFEWAPDGQKLVLVYPPGTLTVGRIWHLNGKTHILRSARSIAQTESDLRFSPDGQTMRFISPIGERKFDLKSGKWLSQRRWSLLRMDIGARAAISSDGILIFKNDLAPLLALDTRTGKTLWKNQTQAYPGFQLSPRGDAVAIDQLPQIKVVNARSGKTRWSQKISAQPQSLKFVFSGDGHELIATDGEKFRVYDAQNGVLKRSLTGPPHGLLEMRAAPQNDAIYFLDLHGNIFRQRTR